ncbi:hypothetical protein ColKHC_12055 [Colletotrichum higginsianum]|nr:hypothetical protein ColKHC_12055 [Colletotrichum higginsianum]
MDRRHKTKKSENAKTHPVMILLLRVLERRVNVPGIGAELVRTGLADRLGDTRHKLLGLGAQRREADAVALAKHDLVAVAVGGGVHRHIVDGAARHVEDEKPDQRAAVDLVNVVHQSLDAILGQEVVAREGETLGREGGLDLAEPEGRVLRLLCHVAEPVVDDNRDLALGDPVRNARLLELVFGAVEGSRDSDAELLHDELAAEAAVERRVRDEVLPLLEDGGEVAVLGEGDGIRVLHDVTGFRVGPHDKLGDDAEAGAGALEGEEEIRVLRVTGALDFAVGRDNFDLNDVVKAASPHA